MKTKTLKSSKIYIIVYIILFITIIILPNIKSFGLSPELHEKIDFISNNPDKLSGFASYTNYEGKDKEGIVGKEFFELLTNIMRKKTVIPHLSREKLEFYSIEIHYNNTFFIYCKFDYWEADNILEIRFVDDRNYTYRKNYEVTKEQMACFYESIISNPITE